ncbi:glucoside xylosyltransferase 2-like isoform X2 [Dreissena polymorpha]|uniref:glucoside xylosyltransferase 2-like isoform X2 n=1 Tax=Dreissena polymorpha TaxID=45954 RepID=UPI0022653090|nr:glucoside xylosyltransferase 2-like isoform X2 [Dreissena polymorpha]
MPTRGCWKMLFKLGLTVIILVAIYMFYAIDTELKSTKVTEGFSNLNNAGQDTKYAADVVDELKTEIKTENEKSSVPPRESIHLAVVACGDRAEETLVMLKSAVLFTYIPLTFHIFTETSLMVHFQQQLDFWPPKYRQRIEFALYNITFPEHDGVKAEEWQKLFKPCACQRLFISDILHHIDSLIYVDTDVLFLGPIEDIWALFKSFNSSHMSALAIEHEDKAIGWYNRFARHPYYGEVGVNSGVMLMNLTRMRASPWLQKMNAFYKEYKLKITFGDQDLINIYFHYHPDQLYIFSCEINYRPDHCMYMSVCKPAEKVGAVILHGCRRVWFEDKQPAFKAVYQAFKEHYLGGSLRYDLLASITKNLAAAEPSNCGKVEGLFTRRIDSHLTHIDSQQQQQQQLPMDQQQQQQHKENPIS